MKKTARRNTALRLAHSFLPAAPSLCEFWAELRRAQAAGEPLPSAPGASAGAGKPVPPAAESPAPAPSPTASAQPAGGVPGSGFGSSGGGYGVGLVLPDVDSRLRIARIMSDLCAKDAARRKKKKK